MQVIGLPRQVFRIGAVASRLIGAKTPDIALPGIRARACRPTTVRERGCTGPA
ncbi:hypothetical protein GCM10011322_06000 [Salinarimonas ramus]|uniref:Uncharacterized protein n=1 Tax=Salinarimonas ramus TaxID=690164 RepID=A0A917V2F3_9HYPH|nr:hypothetical protein GCM10011322_06000 [Salinarimonas ramus]